MSVSPRASEQPRCDQQQNHYRKQARSSHPHDWNAEVRATKARLGHGGVTGIVTRLSPSHGRLIDSLAKVQAIVASKPTSLRFHHTGSRQGLHYLSLSPSESCTPILSVKPVSSSLPGGAAFAGKFAGRCQSGVSKRNIV